jgi:SAM-dependent methyltransferase
MDEREGCECSPCPAKINRRFESSEPKLLTSIDDIERFDMEYWEITKGLPFRTGSILRAPSTAYPRWGIQITDENRSELSRMADWFREKDVVEREQNQELEKIEKSSQSTSIRARMAKMIGDMTKEVLRSVDEGKREIRICNLGASTGQVAVAVAAALSRDSRTAGILERATFHLVDYSGRKLDIAKKGLEMYKPGQIRQHPMRDSEFFNESSLEFDAVVCLGHLHKKPFLNVLTKIHKSLVEKGVLVSGDWHSSLCDEPSFMYRLLEMMGTEKRRLDIFRELMGSLLNPTAASGLCDEEKEAVRQHQLMWIRLITESRDRLAKMPRDPRLYIGGAFRTTKTTMREFKEHGFEVDYGAIRKAFPKMNTHAVPKPMIRGTDRATVMIGLRRHR